jgi:hypothetical protein
VIYFLHGLICLLIPLALCAAETTVVYDGVVTKVREALPAEPDLWLTLPDLTQVSGFVLKAQGACLNELCVPIPKQREQAFLRRQARRKWFNLSELARILRQPVVHEIANSIWLFGSRPDPRMKYIDTLDAPNFTLPDWKGAARSLADFRGKKVLLVTWASW